MFADYHLTLLGAKLYHREYGRHIVMEHYELNPVLRDAINQGRRYHPRHVIAVLLITAIFVWQAAMSGFDENPFADFAEGMLLTVFAILNGRHISNILTFRDVIRNPSAMTGEVRVTHAAVLAHSRYQLWAVLLPLLLVFVMTGEMFAAGGLLGVATLTFAHKVWAKKNPVTTPQSTDTAGSPPAA
jgi:hypothetical protein